MHAQKGTHTMRARMHTKFSSYGYLVLFPACPLVVDFSRRHRAMKCVIELCTVHTAELERLQNLLHFPEEVAMALADTEFELFNSVPAMFYVRHVTLDLSRAVLTTRKPNVQDLIQRFHEVGDNTG